jgi:predicted nucleotidyltransferase
MIGFTYMNKTELVEILKGEKELFDSLADIKEVVLYGSALLEDEIATDINLLILPSREMSEGEKVDLRQKLWERLKDKLPTMLDVQTVSEELSRKGLSEEGILMEPVYTQ